MFLLLAYEAFSHLQLLLRTFLGCYLQNFAFRRLGFFVVIDLDLNVFFTIVFDPYLVLFRSVQ